MKKLIVLFTLIVVSQANAIPSTGRDFCAPQELNNLNAAWELMRSEKVVKEMSQSRVGFRIGDCTPYSLQKIARRAHKTDAPRPYCGLVLILNSDEQLASKQASWILDNLGTSYKTEAGFSIRFCGKLSSGAGPLPGVTVRN